MQNLLPDELVHIAKQHCLQPLDGSLGIHTNTNYLVVYLYNTKCLVPQHAGPLSLIFGYS